MSPVEQQLQSKSAKLAQMQAQDEKKPQGFWGKTGHILSRIGNIAGDIVAPGEMALIPGTELNRQWQERRLGRDVMGLSKEQSEEGLQGATAAHLNEETSEMPGKTASEEQEQGATAANLESEAAARQTPSLIVHDTDAGPLLINPKTADAQRVSLDGQPIGPKMKMIESQPVMGPDGKPHTYMLDEKGNKVVDLGVHYERPINITTPGESRNEKNDLLKAYTPSLESAERFNVMTDAYEKAIKNHDQQAMLNLLANHLGMTMGLQKGARITRDLYQEAAKSTPWLQKIGAHFDSDGYLDGIALNPRQMRQMVNLAQERYQEDTKKARSTAQYLGAKDDGPQRTPGPATIRYYTALANGDASRAKQLAADDGWMVQ